MKQKQNRISTWIVTIVLIFLLVCIGYFGYQIYLTLDEYHQATKAYDTVYATVSIPTTGNTDSNPNVIVTDVAEIIDLGFTIDWDALKEINNDVVGWIYCPDTVINYPVMKSADNEDYLHHLIDGTYNYAGSIFVDYRNNAFFEDSVTILYGHHMKNGSMFASLQKYQNQSYYEEHPVMYLLMPNGDYQLQLFAGFTATENDETYTFNFATDDEYQSWIDRAIGKSNFTTEVDVCTSDSCVLLSTCAYSFENARYVVIAKVKAITLAN